MSLALVQVSAPAVNYVFSPSGVIGVTDSIAPITLPGSTGEGFLQSRTFEGSPGTAAEGLHGYDYRIDITELVAVTGVSCITELSLDFGPIVSLDFSMTGSPADAYVITAGGLGSIRPDSVHQLGNRITFRFVEWKICPSGTPGKSPTTFFFGLVSKATPTHSTAELMVNGSPVTLDARTPAYI